MANKKISDLTSQATISNADELEVQVSGESVTKRSTVEVITKVERDARVLQDNTIETGVGLKADGTYDTPSGTNYIDGTTSVQNALEVLDASIGEGSLITLTVDVPSANLTVCGATPYELIASPGADKVIEVVSVAASLNYVSVAVECGSQDLIIQYDGGASHFAEWTNTFIEGAADVINKGTWTSNAEMLDNAKIELTFSSGADATAGDSTLKIFLTYKIWDLT